jgi:hypothetical protein
MWTTCSFPAPSSCDGLRVAKPDSVGDRRVVSTGQARSLALSLPEAIERDHHGRPSFRVDGKIFATLWDSDHVNVMLDQDGIRTAAQAHPGVCEELRWGKRLAAVSVDLCSVDPGTLADLLADAWEGKAPRRLTRQGPP